MLQQRAHFARGRRNLDHPARQDPWMRKGAENAAAVGGDHKSAENGNGHQPAQEDHLTRRQRGGRDLHQGVVDDEGRHGGDHGGNAD
jgi:hypothetical protein